MPHAGARVKRSLTWPSKLALLGACLLPLLEGAVYVNGCSQSPGIIGGSPDWAEVGNLVLFVATGVLAVFALHYSRRAAEAAENARHDELLPVLALDIVRDERDVDGGLVLVMRNVGRGPALELAGQWNAQLSEGGRICGIQSSMSQVDFQVRTIAPWEPGGWESPLEFMKSIDDMDIAANLEVRLTYEDVIRRRTRSILYKRKFHVVPPVGRGRKS